MKKEQRWIRFQEVPTKGITQAFQVVNIEYGVMLGYVKWYSAWRKYSFFPANNCIFEAQCMTDIVTFINELMEKRKLSRSEKYMEESHFIKFMPTDDNRLRPHLCSRNIEVGDTVYEDKDLSRPLILNKILDDMVELVTLEIDFVAADMRECFRVVGIVTKSNKRLRDGKKLHYEQYSIFGKDHSEITCKITEEDLKNGWTITGIEIKI